MMLIFIVSSCDRIEDGAYSPKEKISKIYSDDMEAAKNLNRSGIGIKNNYNQSITTGTTI